MALSVGRATRRTALGAFVVVVLLASAALASCAGDDEPAGAPRVTGSPATSPPSVTATPPAPTPPTTGPTVVLVGAGDIATCEGRQDEATAALLDRIPGTVATFGDNAYPDGSRDDFARCYDPSWGRHRTRTRPAPGNHDFDTRRASGYFSYFGTAAGPRPAGYYSYALGAWHVVVLNSNCSVVGCEAGSEQERWLRADLAAHPAYCTLAYWHHPRYTSGRNHAPDETVQPLYQALHDHGADVVVAGHNHQYERFAPMDARGGLDTARGLRQFVVGTGGARLYDFAEPQPNSERRGKAWGVIRLTLRPAGYSWQFVPIPETPFTDSGTSACH